MTPSDKKIRTQNWLLPLLVFLIFSIILSCMLYNEVLNNQARVRTLAELNAATYAERMTSELAQGIAVTDSLQGILISGDGHVRNFHQVAAKFYDQFFTEHPACPKRCCNRYLSGSRQRGRSDRPDQ